MITILVIKENRAFHFNIELGILIYYFIGVFGGGLQLSNNGRLSAEIMMMIGNL